MRDDGLLDCLALLLLRSMPCLALLCQFAPTGVVWGKADDGDAFFLPPLTFSVRVRSFWYLVPPPFQSLLFSIEPPAANGGKFVIISERDAEDIGDGNMLQ